MTEFTHKVTSLLRVWRTRLWVTQTLMTIMFIPWNLIRSLPVEITHTQNGKTWRWNFGKIWTGKLEIDTTPYSSLSPPPPPPHWSASPLPPGPSNALIYVVLNTWFTWL